MIKLKNLINELLDYEDSYPFKHSQFSTEEIDYEDPDSGETYKKDVLSPVQIVRFKHLMEYHIFGMQSKVGTTIPLGQSRLGLKKEPGQRERPN